MTRPLNVCKTLSIAAALAACGEQVPPPRIPPPVRATGQTAEESAGGEAPAAETWVYSPIGKRDPFRNMLEAREVTAVVPTGGKVTPLQKWDIDQLVLRMTVTATSTPFAMIEDPEGRGWSVHLGDFVGKHFGKVEAIRRDEITITETIQDRNTGRVYPVHIPMRIVLDTEEKKAKELLKEGIDALRE